MIEMIWQKLNSLSEDAEAAALAKAKELAFDKNKGQITLDESFINLSADVATLKDAIEKKKLIQLPLSVQKEIHQHLENVSNFLTSLVSGTDEIINLVDAIEALHTHIWHLGLQKLSKEYLGYQTKLNQVKQLEVEVRELKRQLQEGVALKSGFEQIIRDAQVSKESLATEVENAAEATKTATGHLEAITDTDQKAAALLATIQQNQVTSSEQVSKTTTSSSEVGAIEGKIKEFYKEIDRFREDIGSTKEKANSTVSENDKQTKELTKELETLEGQIREQIRRATGHSLFHSFQTRQERLAKAKWLWIGALAALILISLCFTLFLAYTTSTFNLAFYLKLSLRIPMLFAIVFCTVQYSHERRLEEEYAFKSNISISLVPYQELIEKLVDRKQAPERERFASFLIDAVTNVFSSPTDKIWETTENDSSTVDKSVKRFVSLVKPIIKGLKH